MAYAPSMLTGQAAKRKHDDTRSSAVAEKPTRRSVSVEIFAYCCTNNANWLAWGALSATATFY